MQPKPISFLSILLSMLALLHTGCTKEKALMYEDDPRVYFKKYNVAHDSVNYSFAVKDPAQLVDSVYLQLRIMGNARPYDREINIQLSDTSTARQGYHFVLGPQIMPAGQYETKIPVYLYRRPGLKDSTITADFIIGASKDFQPGYDDLPTVAVTNRLHYKISMDDRLVKPERWDGMLAPYFGAWSLVKLNFMIRATGRLDWTVLIYPNELSNLSQLSREAMSMYVAANGPLIDENGAVVEFP